MSLPMLSAGVAQDGISAGPTDAELFRQTRRKSRRRRMRAWFFMIPLLAVNVLVIVVPTIRGGVLLLHQLERLRRGEVHRRGQLQDDVHQSGQFWQACLHNVLWTVFFLIVPMAMGLAGAFMLSRITRFQSLFRALLLHPLHPGHGGQPVIWENLLNPTAAGSARASAFLKNISFFGNQRLALGSVAFVNNWQWWGFLVVMFLAAMQGPTPPSMRRPASTGPPPGGSSGISPCRPSGPVLMFLMLMTIIWSFLVFDYIYIITQGGPDNATQVVGHADVPGGLQRPGGRLCLGHGPVPGSPQHRAWSSSTRGCGDGGGTYELRRNPADPHAVAVPGGAASGQLASRSAASG